MDTFKNFAIAQVTTPPSPPTTGTSLVVTPGATVNLPPVPFTVAVFDGTAYPTPTNAELIRVTVIVGDMLSGLIRGYEGSTPRAILAGDYVAQTFTAGFVADVTNSDNQSTGTLPDARLSTNVPLKNSQNIFTATQSLIGAGLSWVIKDPTAPTDKTTFLIRNLTQFLCFQAVNDAISAQQGIVIIDHDGVLYAAAGFGSTPLNASNLFSGTVPDARLSANIALKNTDNHFVAQTLASGTNVKDSNSVLAFENPAAPSNQRCWRFINYGDGVLRLEALTDGFAALQSSYLFARGSGIFISSGGFQERGRAFQMGEWVDVPFNAANFSATGGTWTVGAGAIIANRYTVIGKTMHWSIYLSWFSGGNVAGGSATSFNIAIPSGFSQAVPTDVPVAYANDAGAVIGGLHASIGGNVVSILKLAGGAFLAGPAGGSFGLITTFTFEVL